MNKAQAHWQTVYKAKAHDEVSWFQAEPTVSLAMISALGLPRDAAIIDVGAGASALVDRLVDQGFDDITLVDLADAALGHTKARLGPKADNVHFHVGDVTVLDLGHPYDLWHDRAVLHFLTDASQQQNYRDTLHRHLVPGGHAVIATFAVGGPERCSGLPIRQYDAKRMMALLGDRFTLASERLEPHRTPWGACQDFAYFLVRKEV